MVQYVEWLKPVMAGHDSIKRKRIVSATVIKGDRPGGKNKHCSGARKVGASRSLVLALPSTLTTTGSLLRDKSRFYFAAPKIIG